VQVDLELRDAGQHLCLAGEQFRIDIASQIGAGLGEQIEQRPGAGPFGKIKGALGRIDLEKGTPVVRQQPDRTLVEVDLPGQETRLELLGQQTGPHRLDPVDRLFVKFQRLRPLLARLHAGGDAGPGTPRGLLNPGLLGMSEGFLVQPHGGRHPPLVAGDVAAGDLGQRFAAAVADHLEGAQCDLQLPFGVLGQAEAQEGRRQVVAAVGRPAPILDRLADADRRLELGRGGPVVAGFLEQHTEIAASQRLSVVIAQFLQQLQRFAGIGHRLFRIPQGPVNGAEIVQVDRNLSLPVQLASNPQRFFLQAQRPGEISLGEADLAEIVEDRGPGARIGRLVDQRQGPFEKPDRGVERSEPAVQYAQTPKGGCGTGRIVEPFPHFQGLIEMGSGARVVGGRRQIPPSRVRADASPREAPILL
jgi:hypothetical protein